MKTLATLLLMLSACASWAQRYSELISTNMLAHTNLFAVMVYSNSVTGSRSISFSNWVYNVVHDPMFLNSMTNMEGTGFITRDSGSGTNNLLLTPVLTNAHISFPALSNVFSFKATAATSLSLTDNVMVTVGGSTNAARLISATNLASALIASPQIGGMMNTSGIIRVETWGDNTLAQSIPGYPFAHPTNAWNYLINAGSNNWTMLIGQGTWFVSPGYSQQGQRAAFHALGNLRNIKILGAGDGTIITNSQYGDVFYFGTNSSNVEIGKLAIHQNTNSFVNIISNFISCTILNTTDDITLGTNYYVHDIYFRTIQDNNVFLRANTVLIERLRADSVGTISFVTVATPSGQADGSCISGSGSDWIIRNCFFHDCCYGVEVGGHDAAHNRTNRNWLIENITVKAWTSGLVVFSDASMRFEDIRFVNCDVDSVLGFTNFSTVVKRNGPCSNGFVVGGNTSDIEIAGNRVKNCVLGIMTSPGGGNMDRLKIRDNTIRITDQSPLNADPTVGYWGMFIYPTTADANIIYNSEITGNTVYNYRTEGIAVAGSNIVVRGNTIIDCGYDSVNASAFRCYNGAVLPDFNPAIKNLGNMVFEGNLILGHGQATANGGLFGTITNLIWRNNTHVGSGAKVKFFSPAPLYTNVTWTAMWGTEGTNFYTAP